MAGFIITPRKEDFERITPEIALGILNEVSMSPADLQQVIDKLQVKDQS